MLLSPCNVEGQVTSRVTLKHVALQAGVSFQTVSKVLNGQAKVTTATQERILRIARELGYQPDLAARNLRMRRSNQIGYSWRLMPADQANPLLEQFLQSMLKAAEPAGYHILCFSHQEGEQHIQQYRQLIDANRVDAFVLSGVEYDDPRVAFLRRVGFPFAAFGRSNPDWSFPYVDLDGAAGMRSLVQHLFTHGHRAIAALAFPENSRVGQNRMDGFNQAMNGFGLAIPPELVSRGEGTYRFGIKAAAQLLQLPANRRPSAIVAFNDAMAVGAMHAAGSQGLIVGKDLAITGFDDTPMVENLTPPLTSVRQPVDQIGTRLIKILSGILNGEPDIKTPVLFEPGLVIRQSSDFDWKP